MLFLFIKKLVEPFRYLLFRQFQTTAASFGVHRGKALVKPRVTWAVVFCVVGTVSHAP